MRAGTNHNVGVLSSKLLQEGQQHAQAEHIDESNVQQSAHAADLTN